MKENGNSDDDRYFSVAQGPAIDSIKGSGLPDLLPTEKTSNATPSVITDQGEKIYSTKSVQRRVTDPLPSGEQWAAMDLHARLHSKLYHTHEEKSPFLPRGQLELLLNEESVFKELCSAITDMSEKTLKIYAKKICQDQPSYRKIFAILVLVEMASKIIQIVDCEVISDSDLPLTKKSNGNPGSFVLRRRSNESQHLECFRGWSRNNIWQFELWQWSMLAPFFARGDKINDVKHYQLRNRIIFPYTKDSRRNSKTQGRGEHEGGYASVFRVEIHPDHHDFNKPKVLPSLLEALKLVY
jgi:hypothetical protein